MYLLIDINSCEIVFRSKSEDRVIMERGRMIDGNYLEEDRYIIVYDSEQ